jgi:CheY-like chemotaxis protein
MLESLPVDAETPLTTDRRPFDLVLLDLNMPGMDGFATAKHSDAKFSHGICPSCLETATKEWEQG